MQFTNTIAQISSCESVSPLRGMLRHVGWQFRRAFHRFPVELTIGRSIMLADRPTGVAALVNSMGMYDFNNMTLIQRVLQATGGAFFDVGANIGAYTLIASEVADATVVSIEPHPESYRLLCDNVRLNRRQNVICVNAAASDHEGSVNLSDGGELSTNRVLAGDIPAEKAIPVDTTTLEKVCEDLNIWPVLIKIDVEGHEPFVLTGYSNYKKTDAIIIENGERPGIHETLQNAGYHGPLYFHATANVFSATRQRKPEDPVFIRLPLLKMIHSDRRF
jgi:FkbM family methyltransferase